MQGDKLLVWYILLIVHRSENALRRVKFGEVQRSSCTSVPIFFQRELHRCCSFTLTNYHRPKAYDQLTWENRAEKAEEADRDIISALKKHPES